MIEKTFDINGTELIMVLLPAGDFMMGSNDRKWSQPIHRVKIEQEFYMGKFPVTQAQYKAVMGENPSKFTGNINLPVDRISWKTAQKFCQKLSVLLKQKFRLPSESEWEFACRAGTSTNYWWGDEIDNSRCWYWDNADKKTHPVNEKVNEHTNPFGLCDMNGNVWEWCEDNWEANYETPRTQSPYKNSSDLSILRGGSFEDSSFQCRTTNRHGNPNWSELFGFRIVHLSE